MKTRWERFLKRVTDKRLAVFVFIGLVLLISAIVVQGINLHKLQTLKERRASLAENQTMLAQILDEEAELTTEFLNLTEQASALNGTEEQINKVKADISKVERDFKNLDARMAATQAHIGAAEGNITALEQAADYSWRLFGLILSIGMFFFSYGLTVLIYNLPKKRT